MDDFSNYMTGLADHIINRMYVSLTYDKLSDELTCQIDGTNVKMIVYNGCTHQWSNVWRNNPVGAIAQNLMYIIKNQWVDLLMRKDGV